jgi:hypothetical protein
LIFIEYKRDKIKVLVLDEIVSIF